MPVPFTWVDSFSDAPFRGNPAAVCLLPEARDDAWCLAVAAEVGLSETAFLVRRADGDWDLRWFTPEVEVDLCGHATLASAHTLWAEGHLLPSKPARFHTQSGVLTARNPGRGWIELDFPANPAQETEPDAALLEALGVAAPRWAGRTGHYLLLELASPDAVRALAPDFAALRPLGRDCPAVIVTAESPDEEGRDFVSRVFCPGVGIDEDPVTGAAHTVLAPFWAGRLERLELTGFQASARGGTVRVVHRGERVLLLGRAATVIRGALHA